MMRTRRQWKIEKLDELQMRIEANSKHFDDFITQRIESEKNEPTDQKVEPASIGIFSAIWSKPKPAFQPPKIIVKENSDFDKLKAIKGIYLWGSPGSGKTFVMDLFYETLSLKRKTRLHYNEFMLQIHERIHQLQFKEGDKYGRNSRLDPVEEVAKGISRESSVVCVDEFQVTDIADALILKKLYETLFHNNVVTVSTSNRPPKDLYLNGLQRHLFLPYIDLLQRKCEIINLNGIDYRRTKQVLYQTYHSPLGEQVKKKMDQIFETLANSTAWSSKIIEVMQGRKLEVHKQHEGVAQFKFNELCDRALGSSDYIAIAQNYRSIIVTDVPTLTIENRNVLRRFILLIDELYNKHVNVYISAEKPLNDLFLHKNEPYDEVFAFDRVKSRLIEMQSKEYIENTLNKMPAHTD